MNNWMQLLYQPGLSSLHGQHAAPDEKRCSDCKEVKNKDSFYPKKSYCKQCATVRRRRYPKQYSYKRKEKKERNGK